MIFDLLKKKKLDDLLKYIKENEELDLDIYDENYNYFIQYLVMYNNLDILEYVLKNRTIRLDLLDSDGRNLLYHPIKYNYIDLLSLLIDNDKHNIGLSIFDVRDNNGNIGLHYCIIFNNINAFNKLYKISDITSIDNKGNNIYDICNQYNNSNLFIHILDLESKKSHDLKHFINKKGESVLQTSINLESNNIINYIVNNKTFLHQIINNADNEYGLTALHQSIILNNDIVIKLIENGADINKGDYMGNTPLHYAIIEKNYGIVEYLLTKTNLYYNETNLNGNTPLHLFIDDEIINNIQETENHKHNLFNILLKLIENTDINIMNNNGYTVLYYIVIKNLWILDKVKDILEHKQLNIFITNKENKTIYDINNKEDFINIVVNSYINILKKNSDKLVINWEKYCSQDDIKLKSLLLNEFKKKDNGKDITYICKEHIYKLITDKIKSVPTYNEIILNIDSGIYMESCFYTGSNIDILFGLIYLYNNNNINLLLEYPLTNNKEIENHYIKMGINYSFKMDFCNIEILWSYMKMLYIKDFDALLKMKLNNDFIIIPLGINVQTGSHANIIIIDVKNKRIERFEPNGHNSPRGFYYNQDLLDSTLKIKFNSLLSDYEYLSPKDYLPIIGFQILETLEDKCKKIGDPNGFCGVWCTWWAEQRIKNSQVEPSVLANELIKQIKLSNTSFKKIIRNFSIKIVKLRDDYLNKFNLDINKWMNNDYDEKQLEKLENNILRIL